jgi:hypothetical protein
MDCEMDKVLCTLKMVSDNAVGLPLWVVSEKATGFYIAKVGTICLGLVMGAVVGIVTIFSPFLF